AVVAGDPAHSELVARIHSNDPDLVMPPPELKRPLSEAERSILVQWVEAGAPVDPHWAFVAPKAPEGRRRGATDGWSRDPLDELVLRTLAERSLRPAPEADRATLLRRVSMALTGLPPTPEEIDAFIADQAPGAYERRVDAMLSSPRAAEHMATTWLDLARFADTHGYQSDGPSFTWPWRDWLLHALNRNDPYDRFVRAIIAGDLLPDATTETRVATAFHRLHRMTEEGGSIAEEFRQEGIADRVSTFGATFLGLTLECARCHDHKYDPIPTEEFYGLAAMFGRIDENGMKSFAHGGFQPPPTVRLATPEQEATTASLAASANTTRSAWVAALQRVSVESKNAPASNTSIDASAEDRVAAAGATIDPPAPTGHWPFDALADGQSPNTIDPSKPATTDRGRGEQLGAASLVAGHAGQALACDGDGGVSLQGTGGLTRHDPVTISLWLRPGERSARATILHTSGFYTNDADGSGFELLLDHGRLRWSVIHLWPGSAASIQTTEPLALDRWTHVAVRWEGMGQASGLSIWIDGARAASEIVRDHLDGPIAAAPIEVGSRSRDAGFRSGAIDELKLWRHALTDAEVALLAGREPTQSERAAHAAWHASDAERTAAHAARRALDAHLDAIPRMPCMQDSPYAQATMVLTRGAYDQPDPKRPVHPGAVAAVLPFAPSAGASRVDLAQWLVDPRHPLLARVEVNRLWAQCFGSGLVETVENFGTQGSAPIHPMMLDLLAHDFVHGPAAWDRKAMLRRIALSATFRQSSSVPAAVRSHDPGNALLARGPSVRVSAEQARDSALLAAGLLIERLGGPSVRPYQQPGIAAQAGQSDGYQPDAGEGAHRRSLYTFRKRTVPPPSMLTFDAGTREACQPRRSSTTTPMQAMALLNDPIFIECAQAIAARAMRDATTRTERIARVFRLLAGRAPHDDELAPLTVLVASQAEAFVTDLAAARAISGSDDPEHAALVLAASTVMASDAFVMVR
ncbi:MAG: DUF1553 domain-containing protein, partial [Planctomycetes bacterium]|nr:DUF1553 domain-containing protein [Planctomycetota bacterium]